MPRERLYLFDTTLRDGAQTNGVDFTLANKLAIARLLDQLGIDYVEGGYPGANPTDTRIVRPGPQAQRQIHRLRHDAAAGPLGLQRSGAGGAARSQGRRHLLCRQGLGLPRAGGAGDDGRGKPRLDPRQRARGQGQGPRSAARLRAFFRRLQGQPAYALACAKAAYDEGARWVVLCDTNGGTLPHEVEAIVGEVCKAIPGDHVGIHAHNDTEQAVANSFAAVRAGARQIQGTLNGLGERCGNANLVSIIPTLKLKQEFAQRFDIGVSDAQLKKLAQVSRALDDLLNRASNRHAPYVGESAFATKAGIHASAIAKDPATYEHVMPDSVGNKRKVLVSEQAGKSNVLAELDRIGLKVNKDDPRIGRLLEIVKERETIGYAYEAADASFEMLARRTLGTVPNYFDVTQFDVNVEQRNNAMGERVTVTLAVVKVRVGDDNVISAAEGNGPVNALDRALRKDLGKYQKYIDGLKLTDYRVRILNSGTEAVTRVLIESEDETGDHWTTIGVSANIIDASFQALMDSIVYKLVKSGAPA